MDQGESPFQPPWADEPGGRSSAGDGAPGRRYRWDLRGRRLGRADRRRVAGVMALVVADVLAASLALAVALAAASAAGPWMDRWGELFPLVAVLVLGGQGISGTYRPASGWRSPGMAALGALLSVGTVALLAMAYPALRLPLSAWLVLAGLLALLVGVVRSLGRRAVRAGRRRGLLRRSALVVGTGETAREIGQWLRERGYRELELTGTVPPPPESTPGETLPFPEVGRRIEELGARVVLVPRALPEETFRAVAYQCFLHGADLIVVNRSPAPIPFRVVSQDEHGLSQIELAVPRLQGAQVVTKRALDLAVSGAALAALSPVYAAVALAVKLDSPGPVLFRQERLGKGGRRFGLLKFRSMVENAEEALRRDEELYRRYVEHDYKLPPEEDPRITRLGRFLRRSSLDELPQLLNVFRGDMSLVGPRPIVPPEVEEYGIHAPVLLGVRPGVTGYWQISGRSAVGYPQRARWEIEYVEKWSLWLDLRILARTVPVVLRKVGAH